jgi:hypothetical protein
MVGSSAPSGDLEPRARLAFQGPFGDDLKTNLVPWDSGYDIHLHHAQSQNQMSTVLDSTKIVFEHCKVTKEIAMGSEC